MKKNFDTTKQKPLIFISIIISLLALFPIKTIANDFKPIIIFNFAGKNDKAFGQAAYEGFMRFSKEFDVPFQEYEVNKTTHDEIAIRKAAEKSNFIALISHRYASPLKNIAPDYPEKKFVIIDAQIDLPNVKAITFREEEGAFLAGVMAGLYSKNGKVGFIGGMDIPIIRRFQNGYINGVHYIDKNIKVWGCPR